MTNSQHIFTQGFEAGRHGAIIDVLAHLNNSLATLTEEQQKLRAPVGTNPYFNGVYPVEGFDYAADEHIGGGIEQLQDLIGEIREMIEEPQEVIGRYYFDRIFDKLENFLRNRALTPYRCYVEASVLQGFFDQHLGPGLSVDGADALKYRGVLVRAANYFNSRDTADCVMVLTGLTNDDRLYSVRYNTNHTLTSELK